MPKTFWMLAGFLLLTLWCCPVLAQDPRQDFDRPGLAARIDQLENEVRQLRSLTKTEPVIPANQEETEAGEQSVPPVPIASAPSTSGPPDSGHRFFQKPFSYQLGEGDEAEFPSVRLTGFFHSDAGWIHQDAVNRETLGDIQDGWAFRRARLAAAGNVSEDVGFIVELDFAQSQPWFVDVWMDFQNVGNFMNLRIGRYRQPFGMNELTSIRELPFLERPLLFALAPFRQTGIMAYGNDDEDDSNLTWAVSGYRFLSDNFGNAYGDDGGWGLATRGTMLPIYENGGERLVHLGADYSFNDPGRDVVQFVNVPEFFLGQNPLLGPAGLDKLPLDQVTPFVNTGAVPANHTHIFNLEAAAGAGNLYFQSEARWAVLDRQNGQPTETFPGAYAHVRYILTGEDLPYNRASGLFGRIVPANPVKFGGGGGVGAWEMAARWSWLDLNGTNLPGPGRDLTNLTLGLNWYLNGFTKFQFNYIHAGLDDPDLGESDANIFGMRGQLDF